MYFRFSDEAVFNRFRFKGRSFQLLGKLKDGKSLRLDFLTETIWKLMERSNEFNLVNKLSKERGSFPAIYLCINIAWLSLNRSWNFSILSFLNAAPVWELKLAFEIYLIARFCREQIRFMSLLLEFPQAVIPNSIWNRKSEF